MHVLGRFPLCFIVFFYIAPGNELCSHGLSEYTLVKIWKGSTYIKDIAHKISKNKKIISHRFNKNRCGSGYVRAAGRSESNCYMQIGFDSKYFSKEPSDDDLLCTPSQEFYIPAQDKWIPACQLKVGDELKSNSMGLKAITRIRLVDQHLSMYILEVEKYQNLFVGKYFVLTHNTSLPWAVSIIFSLPFGAGGGASAGGKMGSYFGPTGIIGGIVIGGVIGWFLDSFINQDKIHQYESLYDIEIINAFLEKNNGPKHQYKPNNINPIKSPKKDDDADPSTPVYRRGHKPTPTIQEGLRKPTSIYGRQYSAHAIQRMQERGYTPSVVENVIKNGQATFDKDPGTLNHFDSINNVTVITCQATGRVITIF